MGRFIVVRVSDKEILLARFCLNESTPVYSPYATCAIEGGKAAQEPPIDMLNDDSELHEPEFVDFSAYGKDIHAGLERPPPTPRH
jgi:hypothetical protein